MVIYFRGCDVFAICRVRLRPGGTCVVVVVLGLVGLGVISVGRGVIVGEAVGVAVGGGRVAVMVGVGVNSTRKTWASWIHAVGNASAGISSNAI